LRITGGRRVDERTHRSCFVKNSPVTASDADGGICCISIQAAPGPRRFRLPVSVGRITVRGRELLPELINLIED